MNPEKGKESFETLFSKSNVVIKRIISNGFSMKRTDDWFIQDEDEWVMVLEGEGELEFEGGERLYLYQGEHVYIPSGKKHRVSYTTNEPNCMWLAVYIKS